MKIYTKTGDAGQTGLLGGPRVDKDAPRIEAYGTVDELNSTLGLVRAEGPPPDVDQVLDRVQNELFNLGAELAAPASAPPSLHVIGPDNISWQEHVIDRHEAELAPLHEFILPGGSKAASLLHVARCICRRAERRVVALRHQEAVRPEIVIYLNRLSDLLFVLARATNKAAGVADVKWRKDIP